MNYKPMTTNFELEKWAQKYNIPLNAIVSKNHLQEQFPRSGGYIINMADSDKPGTHWVGLWLTKNKKACYFDSFGIVPPIDVVQFCKRFGAHTIMHSDKQIQNLAGGFCGQYTLLFLHHMSRKPAKISLQSWYKYFEDYFEDD